MRYILLIYLSLIGFWGYAQSITAAEYFFDDNDLGIGNNTALSVNSNTGTLVQSYLIPTTGLSDGFHSLYIRTYDPSGSGKWSHYDRSIFYVGTVQADQDIVSARYFFNGNAPVGLTIDTPASSVSQSYSITTAGLSEGFHSLYIETQAADGTWSLYDRQVIYVKDFNEIPSEVVSGEYFVDEDMGFGNNTPLGITMSTQVISFDTTGLSEGDHLFCVRVLNDDGTWSLNDCEIFTIDSSLGIEDSLYKSVKVNPNPFSSTISLDVSRAIVFQKISVIDIAGREVYSSTENLRYVNLEYLESGTYILSLSTETEKATFKIVKQ